MLKSELEVRECVGCGYCCRKAPCGVAVRIYGNVTECPALKWNDSRYVCDLCVGDSNVAAEYREELYIGVGCCSPLNTDRNNIPAPRENLMKLPKETQEILTSMARQFMSGDMLWLALYDASAKLGEDWFKTALHFVEEQRSAKVKEFMG